MKIIFVKVLLKHLYESKILISGFIIILNIIAANATIIMLKKLRFLKVIFFKHKTLTWLA